VARLRALIATHKLITAVAVGILLVAVGMGAWLGVRAAQDDVQPIEKVFKQYQDYLLNLPGVVSVGIGERFGKRFIQIYVRELTPAVAAGIPKTFGGWKVRLQEIPDPDPEPQSPSPSPDVTELPDPSSVVIDIRGTVVGISRLAEPDGQVLGWMLVQGEDDRDMSCLEASVAITTATGFYLRRGDELVAADSDFSGSDLRGAAVEVEFAGETTGSDPPQATASVVIFVDAVE
jgi:hypothetical protein